MSKIIFQSKNDDKINEIKLSVENFLSEISSAERQLFSYQEVENILLDIYSLTRKN
jgi:inosine/xanthosine triphosphate pyrophosphatase family protein